MKVILTRISIVITPSTYLILPNNSVLKTDMVIIFSDTVYVCGHDSTVHYIFKRLGSAKSRFMLFTGRA